MSLGEGEEIFFKRRHETMKLIGKTDRQTDGQSEGNIQGCRSILNFSCLLEFGKFQLHFGFYFSSFFPRFS